MGFRSRSHQARAQTSSEGCADNRWPNGRLELTVEHATGDRNCNAFVSFGDASEVPFEHPGNQTQSITRGSFPWISLPTR